MRRSLCALGAAATILGSTMVSPNPAPDATTIPFTQVDLVFVLDTTGSMSGMISESKQKIWSIVRALTEVHPTPDIRLGLLAYRDRGDKYVTRLVPLTRDFDSAYVRLMELEAQGGGDGPESVNQALHEAVDRFDWSGDPGTLRAIFLVGDAPPHMDYRGEVQYPQSCARAAGLGIRIHAIQCGSNDTTREIWRRIATCAQGDYFAIAAPGSGQPITTPYDWQLALHSRLLDQTILPYGSEEQQEAQRKRLEASKTIDAEASAEAKAERARVRAGAARLVDEGDLVDDVQSGTADLESIPEERLPARLKKIPQERRRQFIDDLAEQRRGLRSEIEWFATKRAQYIEENYGGQDAALDRRVIRSLLRDTPSDDD